MVPDCVQGQTGWYHPSQVHLEACRHSYWLNRSCGYEHRTSPSQRYTTIDDVTIGFCAAAGHVTTDDDAADGDATTGLVAASGSTGNVAIDDDVAATYDATWVPTAWNVPTTRHIPAT